MIKMPKMAGVTDESMLESTLLAFDSQYLTSVFNKDVINSAMAVQQAGVIVTDYDVETIEDAANHYQLVTMRLTPVDGEPSTIDSEYRWWMRRVCLWLITSSIACANNGVTSLFVRLPLGSVADVLLRHGVCRTVTEECS